MQKKGSKGKGERKIASGRARVIEAPRVFLSFCTRACRVAFRTRVLLAACAREREREKPSVREARSPGIEWTCACGENESERRLFLPVIRSCGFFNYAVFGFVLAGCVCLKVGYCKA